jgi:hypothetical protein
MFLVKASIKSFIVQALGLKALHYRPQDRVFYSKDPSIVFYSTGPRMKCFTIQTLG